MADPTLTSSLLNNRRRRAMIACTNCRKRKIKCVTSEEPPRNPCARCTKRSLPCEYVAVDEDSPTPEGPVPLHTAAYPYPTPASYGSAPPGRFPYSTPPSQHGGWNPPQPHSSHPGYVVPPQAQSSSYRSSSSYGPDGSMYGGSTGFSNNVQYYQQQQPFSAAPPTQWAQGSAQQQAGCSCPNAPCFYHHRRS